MINQTELKELFSYDPNTGKFCRLTKPCNSVKVGVEPGWVRTKQGNTNYRLMDALGKQYKAHRLAYLYMTGSMPKGEIDHIDGNGLNNRWYNLRDVDRSTNQRNRKLNENNTSCMAGVSYFKQTGKWRAAINIGGKKKHLGYFATFDEAKLARVDAEKMHGYHENHGRR